MKKLYFPILLIVIILIVFGVYFAIKNWQPVPPEEGLPIVGDEVSRKEIMADVSEKIAQISPKKPVLGGKWFVTRFWFVQGDNENFYVEYEDGHILRQILVEAKKKNGEIDYKVIAYFEPGETTWDLKDGEDKFFGSLLDLYEFDEELGEWIKRN